MDVDWCLSCERKLNDRPGPYCSPQCLSYAQPALSPVPDHGALRIHQWASAIPPHVPAGAPLLPFSDLAPTAPLPASRPPSPRSRHQSTPKLIERTTACTPLPTLCVSSPAHIRPTLPPRAHSHTYSQRPTTSACLSEASTSLSSLLTEPLVATPDEDASFGANIGALVRSWVGRDRANSTKSTNQDWVIEKVTDYFPALPHPKKTLPSKKTKHTPSHSPAPTGRRKPPAKKVAPPNRDHSTPTHSHTPTPVVFPSCRAWVDEDEQGRDELLVAPQPQYHPSYFLKCSPSVEPTRSPSLSSSSDSSVLLMAPKRAHGVRGRRGALAIAA